MHIHAKHGKTKCKTFTLNGQPNNLVANVKNPMYFNGYVWKTGAKVSVFGFSTTSYYNFQDSNLGIDTVVIFLRMNMMNVNKIADFTHSPMLTRTLI
jgi:hypothetical protein